jgi:hypothetical protein
MCTSDHVMRWLFSHIKPAQAPSVQTPIGSNLIRARLQAVGQVATSLI